MRKTRKFLTRSRAGGALLALLMLASACGGAASTATGSSSGPAETAPPAAETELVGSFATLSDTQFDLASLEGQDAVLWFWAPW